MMILILGRESMDVYLQRINSDLMFECLKMVYKLILKNIN